MRRLPRGTAGSTGRFVVSEPPESDIESRVRASFARQTFMATLGARLERVAPGEVDIALPYDAKLAQQHGFVHAGATVERIPGTQGLGDNVRARFHHAAAGSPGILVLCHLDTVHPVGTLAALPWRIEGDRCYGPGVLDMKGGTFLALHAMKALARSGAGTPLPVTFLFTCDEEIGSPSTRELIEREAVRHKYVLIPEPARRDGAPVADEVVVNVDFGPGGK